MRILVALVLMLVLLPFYVPAAAAVEAAPLPLGPGTGHFTIGAIAADGPGCMQPLMEAHQLESTGIVPYASNNPEDPCLSEDGHGSAFSMTPNTPYDTIDILMLPVVPAGQPLAEGEPMTATVVFRLESLSPFVPVTAIHTDILFMLIVGPVVLGAVEFEEITTMAVGEDILLVYEVDFGPAPEKLTEGGPMRLRVSFPGAELIQTDPPYVGTRLVLETEGLPGSVTVPFA